LETFAHDGLKVAAPTETDLETGRNGNSQLTEATQRKLENEGRWHETRNIALTFICAVANIIIDILSSVCLDSSK
jgi:hypothetical protein